ncbi:adenosylcobinamide amidohydrolase [Lysinibacillus sp. 54212]|uniref:adenosylcobinamide amidohydrolase n=1 Tax=Lysinibacillus sp. 54212 TaxID=3119829 RepID=UPI002FC591EB
MSEPIISNYGIYSVASFKKPLLSISSAMINPGLYEASIFINRTVPVDYNPQHVQEEFIDFLVQHDLPIEKSVAMMTAVNQEFLFIDTFQDGELTLTVMLTAGLGNAVDITASHRYTYQSRIGTINIFVFIDGHLTVEALMQAYSAVTETKVKTLIQRNIVDKKSGTLATGTSTDSVCVAATQQGELYPYAGSITKLGSLIGKGVAHTLHRAIDNYIIYTKGRLK